MRFPFSKQKPPSLTAVTPAPTPDTPIIHQNHPTTTGRLAPPSTSTRSTIVPDVTSSKAKATLNAFKVSLDALGKSPIPAIGTITTVLLRVIDSLQESSEVGTGWQQLAKRMEHLTFLVFEIGKFPKIADRAEELCRPLKDALNKLADDIDMASKQGRLSAFFNTTDDLSSISAHGRQLDSIVGDLTLAICARTPLTEEKLEEAFQNAMSIAQEQILSNDSSDGLITYMTNNEFDEIGGDFDSHNTVAGANVKIVRQIHGNKFGNVKGHAFSYNKALRR